MTPWQLDLTLNGLFIYERADGTTYKSHDYKLRDYGIKCVGRTGPLSNNEWQSHFDAIAAATGTAKTPQAVECAASQSGGKAASPKGNRR